MKFVVMVEFKFKRKDDIYPIMLKAFDSYTEAIQYIESKEGHRMLSKNGKVIGTYVWEVVNQTKYLEN